MGGRAGEGAAWGALATRTWADGRRSTSLPSQTGHVTSRASFWRSNSAAEASQPSNECPLAQRRSKMIIGY